MKFKFITAALAGLILSANCFINSANAGLISADLLSSNDGLLIEDTTTGLQWADWSMHPGNISVDDFFSSSLWAGQGFRLATQSEIMQLFTGAGADNFTFSNPWGNATTANIAAILEVNSTTLHTQANNWADTNGNSWIHAFYDDGGNPNFVSGVRFNSTSNAGTIDFFGNDNYSKSQLWDPQWSVMAVRQTEVPEPSTLAIFALGMMGLASRRFNKKS